MEGFDPLSRWRFTFEGTWYLTREVAESLGLSQGAVRGRCASMPALTPKKIEPYAGHYIWLWSPDEAEALRIDIERNPIRTGRPRLWSAQQSQDRHRRRVRAFYWRRAAELAHHQGRTTAGARAEAKAEALTRGLEAERPGVPGPD